MFPLNAYRANNIVIGAALYNSDIETVS